MYQDSQSLRPTWLGGLTPIQGQLGRGTHVPVLLISHIPPIHRGPLRRYQALFAPLAWPCLQGGGR